MTMSQLHYSNLDDYWPLFLEAQQAASHGTDSITDSLPCPLCFAPDILTYRPSDFAEVTGASHLCKVCSRSSLVHTTEVNGAPQYEVVQTGGPPLPEDFTLEPYPPPTGTRAERATGSRTAREEAQPPAASTGGSDAARDEPEPDEPGRDEPDLPGAARDEPEPKNDALERPAQAGPDQGGREPPGRRGR